MGGTGGVSSSAGHTAKTLARLVATIFLGGLALVGFALAVNRMSHWGADADRVTLQFLYDDLIVRGTDISGWQMSECNFLFPDAVLLFGARALTSEPGVAFALYAFAYVALLVGLSYCVISALLRDRGASWLATAGAAFCYAAALCAVSGDPASALYPSVHGGAALLVAALVAICVRGLLQGWGARWLSLIVLLIALGELSDPLLAVQFGAPGSAALLVLPALGLSPWRAVLRPLAAIAAGFGLGLALRAGVTAFGVFKIADMHVSVGLSWRSLQILLRSLSKGAAAHLSHYSLILATILASASVLGRATRNRIARSRTAPDRAVSQAALLTAAALDPAVAQASATSRAWQDARQRAQVFLASFFLAVLAAMLGALILTGHVREPQRYLQPAWLLPAFFLSALLGEFPKRRRPRWLATAGCSVLLLVCAQPLLSAWLQRPNWNFGWGYSAEVACVDAFAQRHGAKVGYSEYWRAKPLSARSRVGLRVYQTIATAERLEPYFWLNNSDWYQGTPEPGAGEPVLLITGGLRKANLRRQFGSPKDSTNCGTDYGDVWAY